MAIEKNKRNRMKMRKTKSRKQNRKGVKEARKDMKLSNIDPIVWVVAVMLFLSTIIYLYVSGQLTGSGRYTNIEDKTTTTNPFALPANCGYMQVEVDTIIEASSYYRFGIQRPALENGKFVILQMTVENMASTQKDFSGYRLELNAGDGSYEGVYIPLTFNDIEGVTLLDDTFSDYACEELPLAHVSRLELEPGEKMTGCKIFQVVEGLEPKSLSIYDLEGTLCRVLI